jgi:hypothetical protein
MARLPQFNIYKGTGAMKVRLLPPILEPEDGKYPTPGCMFLEMCKSTGQKDSFGNPTYNWVDDKIVMKLSDKDVADIIIGLRTGKASLIHDPSAGTAAKGSGAKKLLNVEAGQREGTVFISMKYGEQTAKVPLDANEKLRFGTLLSAAILALYGWN